MGEQANMFAFAKSADAVFDSALHYELGVRRLPLAVLAALRKSRRLASRLEPSAPSPSARSGSFSAVSIPNFAIKILLTSSLLFFFQNQSTKPLLIPW